MTALLLLRRFPILSCLLVGAFLFGCAPPKKITPPYKERYSKALPGQQHDNRATDIKKTQPPPPPTPPVTVDPALLLPVMTMVDDRIYAYEKKMQEWERVVSEDKLHHTDQEQRNRIDRCRQQLQEVLMEYTALHRRLLQKESLPAAQLLAEDSLLPLSSADIAYLESGCREFRTNLETSTLAAASAQGNMLDQEKEINAASVLGNWGQVIERYQALPLNPGEKPSFATTYQYGQALLHTGREAEARNVFIGLLDDIRRKDQALWEFRLLQLIGDLEFGLELYEQAKRQYAELDRSYKALGETQEWAKQQRQALDIAYTQKTEVNDYAAFLKGYLAYDPSRDGYRVVEKGEAFIAKYPYSPVASNAEQLIKRARIDAAKWLEESIAQVDLLAAEGRYREALLQIEQIPLDILPREQQEMLRRKTGELTTAEAISIETEQLAEQQALEGRWNTAMVHLENKEYDLAIEGFTGMSGTSYEQQAQEKILEATELAASEDRRRAAELFVRASHSPDLETKKKLLFASRQLVQDILVKYPQSELIEKVTRNLTRIEEEINRLDPALLMTPTTLEGVPAAGATGTTDRGSGTLQAN
ncbi:MAG: hypothetical protein CSA34_07470 [Desulfobulbus propionicus]|nr:MAG: hypothetical protein CSA34_07470 [Desulfobulbus propionicus]